VALVDAKHLPLRLKDSREAEDQIAFADVVLINKTDLVSPEELARIEATVSRASTRRPASTARPARKSDLTKVLDQGAFNLERASENDPHFLDHDAPDHACGPDCGHDHHHHHDQDHAHHDHDHPTTIMTMSIIITTTVSRRSMT
jgi:G3E family GTPase